MTKTRKRASQQEAALSTTVLADVPLSPHWAFVVQFRAAPRGPVYEGGRVEHLASGRTNHFQSLEELSAYLSAELRAAANPTKS